ncbi:MAG: DUF3078 domain-containing protein [Prevotella sp.]|nr:DUF3078 domain-containing protein [Prevotella sp.]
MKKIMFLACMMAATMAHAQEVDKEKVQTQAEAAAEAKKALKEVDTGDKIWKFSGVTGLNAAATSLSNWAAGGNDNINGVIFGRLRLLYHKDKIAWDNNLDLEYGMSYIDQKDDKVQKSSDRIKFNSKVGYEFAPKWYAAALLGFNTQFALGRSYEGKNDDNPIISKFFAPAYTDVSIGIDWKPNDIFSVYMSPIAGRFTTVSVSKSMNREYQDLYPLADGGLERVLKEKYAVWKYDDNNNKDFSSNTRAELGFSVKAAMNYSIKDLKVTSTLGLYTPYASDRKKIDINKDDPEKALVWRHRDNNRCIGNFDVDWDLALSYQLFKCLQMTFSTSMKYYNGVMIADKDGNEAERLQFKTILGVGVGYNF